jgi:hypothetical protein
MSLNSSRAWKKGPYSRGTRLSVRHLAHSRPRTAAPPPRGRRSAAPHLLPHTKPLTATPVFVVRAQPRPSAVGGSSPSSAAALTTAAPIPARCAQPQACRALLWRSALLCSRFFLSSSFAPMLIELTAVESWLLTIDTWRVLTALALSKVVFKIGS